MIPAAFLSLIIDSPVSSTLLSMSVAAMSASIRDFIVTVEEGCDAKCVCSNMYLYIAVAAHCMFMLGSSMLF